MPAASPAGVHVCSRGQTRSSLVSLSRSQGWFWVLQDIHAWGHQILIALRALIEGTACGIEALRVKESARLVIRQINLLPRGANPDIERADRLLTYMVPNVNTGSRVQRSHRG